MINMIFSIDVPSRPIWFNACVKKANFPFIKTLDDFEFDFQPGINRKEMLELGNLGFIDRKENILFVGSSGVGNPLAVSCQLPCLHQLP